MVGQLSGLGMSTAIVKVDTRPYRKIAQEHWGLTTEQMKGMHVHHRVPQSKGGTNDPSNLYVCSPSFHAHVWHKHGQLPSVAPPAWVEASSRPRTEQAKRNISLAKQRKDVRANIQFISYWYEAGLSTTELGAVFNCSHNLIYHLLVEAGTDIRPMSEFTFSQASRANMSKGATGKVLSEEHKKNIGKALSGKGNSFYGKKHSAEALAKISAANLRQPIRVCPHCGFKTKSAGMYNRWHGDSCKYA